MSEVKLPVWRCYLCVWLVLFQISGCFLRRRITGAKVLCGYDARLVLNAIKFPAARLSLKIWPSVLSSNRATRWRWGWAGRIWVGATILVSLCCGEAVINIYHILACSSDVSTSSVSLCKSVHLITAVMLRPIFISLPSMNTEWKAKFQWHQEWWGVFLHSTWQKSNFQYFIFSIKPEDVSQKLSKPCLPYSSLEALLFLQLLSPSDRLKLLNPNDLIDLASWRLSDLQTGEQTYWEAEPGSLIRDVTVQLISPNGS